MRPAQYLDPDTAAMIDLTEKRFWLMFEDAAEFKNLIAKGLAFRSAQYADEKLNLVTQNLFSAELFEAMVCGGESYRTKPINFIWDCLSKHRVVVRSLGHSPRAFVDHALDVPVLLEHLRGETFRNLFAPPAGLASHYEDAIVAIDVLKDGTCRRGSGFLLRLNHDSWPWIVTCRHNVDPADGIEMMQINSGAGKPIPVRSFILSDKLDLAIAPVEQEVNWPTFRIADSVSMFEEVFTLGFPNLPGAYPVLAGHRGEVNAITETYLEKTPAILISNLVAPGSSGCPVLLDDGRCVGMTIRWLEGEADGNEKFRFSAALPASNIRELIAAQKPD